MKPMKCRAWDKEVNMMVEPHTIDFNLKCAFYVDGNSETNRVGLDNLMLFTGLLDKNGKEIYEGDIVSSSWNNCDRVIDDIRKVDWFLSDGFLAGQNGDKPLDAEIIGNIHSNPELLTQ